MIINATELKENLSKYLLLSVTEDIYIARDGKVISYLFQQKMEIAESLFGVLPDDITIEEACEERINRL